MSTTAHTGYLTPAPASYYAPARAHVAATVPGIGVALTGIEEAAPQGTWLQQQQRANATAHRALHAWSANAAFAFAAHTAAATHPLSLGVLRDAVAHALGAVDDRRASQAAVDVALAVVLYVVGRDAAPVDVYRRAVAPLVQAGADLPYHHDETPHGKPAGHEWDRGRAFRAGYRARTHGEPYNAITAARMHPGAAHAYDAGYLAARQDQDPA